MTSVHKEGTKAAKGSFYIIQDLSCIHSMPRWSRAFGGISAPNMVST